MKNYCVKGYYALSGRMANGCRECVKGEKLVLFITGLCANKCFYCPLPVEMRGRDLVMANERPVRKDSDLINEALSMRALGAGFTGGEPLLVIDRVIHYIKLLKNKFGKSFHIHLYTAMPGISDSTLKALDKAGLDELRIHPVNLSKSYWPLIKKALNYSFDVGVEVPALPGRLSELKELADYLNSVKAKFLNINELELTEPNYNSLKGLGYCFDKDLVSAKGSRSTALKLIDYAKKLKLSVYYCSAGLKDAVQFRERLKRTAKQTAKPYELITSDGTLIKGVIKGSIGALRKLAKDYHLKAYLNKTKQRLELSVNKVESLSKLVDGLEFGVLESYPTFGKPMINYSRLK